MTVIVNTMWGGRISQIVDRQISLRRSGGNHTVIDTGSNKVVIVLARDALASIAYTGVAAAHQVWMDCQIANCLAHTTLEMALIQCGTRHLARPIHVVMKELAVNLNGWLNSDKRARIEDLKVSIVGWHLGRTFKPFAWELRRDPRQENGMRYFKLATGRQNVGKFLREHPTGLWGETLGNPGDLIDGRLAGLTETEGMNHDEFEFYFRDAIHERSHETETVSSDCIAVQLDPRIEDWQVRVTYYPAAEREGRPLLSPWVMTSRVICAPSEFTSNFLPVSECGRYDIGGFEDRNTNLKVQLRLPVEHRQCVKGIRYSAQQRRRAP